MLDSFLSAAYTQDKKTKEKRAFVETLKKLPKEELYKVASGELKIANLCSVPGDDGTWLSRFKDTPLFAQALMLEQQALQLDAEDISRRSQQRNDDIWLQRDQIQLQKRLLELQLVQGASAQQAGGVPPVAPGPISPEAGTQGAGALGPEAGGITDGGIQDRPDSTGVKTGADLETMKTAMSMAKLALELAHADAAKLASEKTAILDTALATYLGRQKAQEAGSDPTDGGIRGGLGYVAGQSLGSLAGGALGAGAGGLAGLLARDPATKALLPLGGMLAGGVGGGVLGGIKGYKHFTKKYDKAENKEAMDPSLLSKLEGAAQATKSTAMRFRKNALPTATGLNNQAKSIASGMQAVKDPFAKAASKKLDKQIDEAYTSYDAVKTPAHRIREFLGTIGGGTTGVGIGAGIGYGGGHVAKALGANVDPRSAAVIGGGMGGLAGAGLGSIFGGSHGSDDVRLGKRHERILSLEAKYAFSLPPGLGGAASRIMGKLGPQGTKALIGAGVGAVGGGLLGARDRQGGISPGGALTGALGGAALGGAGGMLAGNTHLLASKGVPLRTALSTGLNHTGLQLASGGRQALLEGRQLIGGLSGPKAPAA